MEENELNKIIDSNLRKYKIGNLDETNSATQSQYTKIEDYLQKCIAEYHKFKDDIEKIDVSVKGICVGSGVGRSTVYASNNTNLRIYVENRISEIEGEMDVFNKKKLELLKKQFAEAAKKYDSLKINTIKQAELELENRKLKIANETLETQKQQDAEEREQFVEQITLLQRKIADLQVEKNTVVQMESKKKQKQISN